MNLMMLAIAARHFWAVCFLPQVEENGYGRRILGRDATSQWLERRTGQRRGGMTIGEPANQSFANQDPANQNKDKNPLAGQKLTEAQRRAQDRAEAAAEARLIRRLQVMISMVSSVISQDPGITVEEASELAAGAKRAALAMFPDKELAYDLLYKPRLQRLMRERFRLQ